MAIVDAFIDALNRLEDGRDEGPLVALFASDAALETPTLAHHGLDVANFWREYRDSFEHVRTTFRETVAHGRRAMLEWTSEGSLVDGTPFRYGGVTVLDLEGDVIRAMRAYFDPRPLHAKPSAEAAEREAPVVELPQGIP